MRKQLDVRRLLLKVSGEVLGGECASVDFGSVGRFAEELKGAHETGTEIAVVIGGGNIVRGYGVSRHGVDRAAADCMGMLGTIINALALQSAVERLGVDTRVMTAIKMEQFAEPYIRRRALEHLSNGRLVILAGGICCPLFSTGFSEVIRS